MRLFFLSIFFLTVANIFAQQSLSNKYLEAGVMLGPINYSGDLAEKSIEVTETRMGFGLFARYHFSSRFALKAQLFTGKIAGTDENAITQELIDRSLQFTSKLLEISLVTEWNFMNIKPVERNEIIKFRIIPYLYVGAGGVFMNPKVEYYGPPSEFNVHVPYSLHEAGSEEKAIVLPFGFGLRTHASDEITLGLEGGFRPVLSDYLDGVKFNGKANSDWYYNMVATFSYSFGR